MASDLTSPASVGSVTDARLAPAWALTVTITAANEADVEHVANLLHGKEQHVWADSGYRGAQRRVDREDLQWHIAAWPSDIAKLPEGRTKAAVKRHEHRKASVRAKVEHPFRVSPTAI